MMNKRNQISAPNDGTKLFSDKDIERAKSWLESAAKRPIISAIRFRNSLQALLRGVERTQAVIQPLAIMAVDTTEITPLIRYSNIDVRNFSFMGLLGEGIDEKSGLNLGTLDRLIIQHLLHGRKHPFLLLEPHAEEVQILKNVTEESLRVWGKVRETKYGALNSDQRQKIKNFFDSLVSNGGSVDGTLSRQWSEFKSESLSDLSDSLLSTLLKSTAESKSFNDFINHAKFIYIRPSSAGSKSLGNYLADAGVGGFVWDDYEAYAKSSEAAARGEEIQNIVRDLLTRIRVKYKDKGILDAAIQRDAVAFSVIDSVNSYFFHKKIDARIDFIGRSPSLHDVIAALPEGMLHVTLRHPLFLPDIYNFDRAQLNTLGESLQRLDATLASALDIDALIVDGRSDPEKEKELLVQVEQIARSVLEILADAVVVRQALESQALEDALRPTNNDRDNLAELVQSFFEAVDAGGGAGEDLLSRSHFHQLVEQNRALVTFARPRVFGNVENESLEIRLIDFFPENHRDPNNRSGDATQRHPVEGFTPDALMVIRATGGSFRQIFHIHSKNISSIIREHIETGQHEEIRKDGEPTSVKVPIEKLFESLDTALAALSAEDPQQEKQNSHIVRNLDATLVVCIAFAGQGRYDTAIALASTVLHNITSSIRRRAKREIGEKYLRSTLAYRELFLFRYYCERALARRDFFSGERRFTNSKGAVAKNLARAQRDLDFATLMSEDAERCLLETAEGVAEPAPAGEQALRDGRLKLAHLGGWIDNFLILIAAEGMNAAIRSGDGIAQTYRGRLDIFTAAGLAKEITLTAWQMRMAAETIRADHRHRTGLRRYLAHQEACCLQGALTVFLLFMAFPLSPSLHRLWLGDILEPERILVFRDWQTWLERYQYLSTQHNFSMRLKPLIELVCGTLQEAAKLEPNLNSTPNRSGIRDPRGLRKILDECQDKLKQIKLDSNEGGGIGSSHSIPTIGFVGIIAGYLSECIADIITRTPQLAHPK